MESVLRDDALLLHDGFDVAALIVLHLAWLAFSFIAHRDA